MTHDDLRLIGDPPKLRKPVLLAAWEGWNDAGDAATYALRQLNLAWQGTRFAEIDPETFYDFTESRPTINLGPAGQRRLTWPENRFFAHRLPDQERDVVLLIGDEPQLRWRTYCDLILSVAHQVRASCLVTLGALLADVPHTREPTLTGFASNRRLLPQLEKLGVHLSAYEGPTGIVGAMHDAWRTTNLPAISLWGNVPHYISATPNPQVSLALLHRVGLLLGASLPTGPLENHAHIFARQVEDALKENPEALEYVRQLEEQYVEEEPPQGGPELFDALEQFLRSNRPTEDAESE